MGLMKRLKKSIKSRQSYKKPKNKRVQRFGGGFWGKMAARKVVIRGKFRRKGLGMRKVQIHKGKKDTHWVVEKKRLVTKRQKKIKRIVKQDKKDKKWADLRNKVKAGTASRLEIRRERNEWIRREKAKKAKRTKTVKKARKYPKAKDW